MGLFFLVVFPVHVHVQCTLTWPARLTALLMFKTSAVSCWFESHLQAASVFWVFHFFFFLRLILESTQYTVLTVTVCSCKSHRYFIDAKTTSLTTTQTEKEPFPIQHSFYFSPYKISLLSLKTTCLIPCCHKLRVNLFQCFCSGENKISWISKSAKINK